MPRYDYQCDRCGDRTERDCSYDDRTKAFKCKCGGRMRYGMHAAPGIGVPGHQNKAVFADPMTGKTKAVVPGHFGKEAKRKRSK